MNLDLGDTRLIIAEAARENVLRNQLAYMLATARWETNHTVKPVKEAYWLSEGWRKKNLRYYPWYGRGYVQLTWEANYIRAGRELDLDLTTDPEVAMRPQIAAQILVRGSMDGWFTGHKIGDHIARNRSDFVNARRVINGTDKAAKIAKIAMQYDTALKADGYGEDNVAPPVVDYVKTPARPSGWGALIAAILRLFRGG